MKLPERGLRDRIDVTEGLEPDRVSMPDGHWAEVEVLVEAYDNRHLITPEEALVAPVGDSQAQESTDG